MKTTKQQLADLTIAACVSITVGGSPDRCRTYHGLRPIHIPLHGGVVLLPVHESHHEVSEPGAEMTKTFKIEYQDPDTKEVKTQVREFEDAPGMPALMWADDLGYMWSDKGWYTITEVK